MGPAAKHANSLAVEAQSVGTDPQSALTTRLRAALEQVGCQQKEAAYACGYDPGTWSRILAGERAINLNRLAALPPEAQRRFVRAWAMSLGLGVSEQDEHVAAVADVLRAVGRFLDVLNRSPRPGLPPKADRMAKAPPAATEVGSEQQRSA